MSRVPRRLRFGLMASALVLVIGGLAFADEGDFDDPNDAAVQDTFEGDGPPVLILEIHDEVGEGPPWLEFEEIEWRPGDGKPPWAGFGNGPPPWAEGSGVEVGEGPPWLEFEEIEWRPGDGKPPWAGQGNGPPPWAGGGDDDDNG
jgi:hypothetical protein